MSSLSLLFGERREEPSSQPRADCPLCQSDGGRLLWRGAFWRLVAADDPHLPGFVRLVANRHCAELTALATIERAQLFTLMIAIENEMRDALLPEKINHASLGNQVPHLHWHIIPRWNDDPFFPDSIWSAARPSPPQAVSPQRQQAADALLSRLPAVCAKAVY